MFTNAVSQASLMARSMARSMSSATPLQRNMAAAGFGFGAGLSFPKDISGKAVSYTSAPNLEQNIKRLFASASQNNNSASSVVSEQTQSLQEKKLAFIGCGKMGSALLSGWLSKGVLKPENTTVNNRSEKENLVALNKEFPFALNFGKVEIASPSDFIVLAVKPGQIGELLKNTPLTSDCFISVAAGVSIQSYESILGSDQPIIRVMPNTPSEIGEGMTALYANKACTPEHIENAKALFEATGKVVVLDNEDQMHAFTALSGSMPAFVYKFIDSIAEEAEKSGFSKEMSLTIAYQVVGGSAEYARTSEKSLAVLADDVTSKGGTTRAGRDVFDDNMDALMHKTIKAAENRSRELAGEQIQSNPQEPK